MMSCSCYRSRGYSLVETLIAIAIMSLLILAVASLLSVILASEKRNRAVAEVEAQANASLYQVAQSLRNATSITLPATSTTAATLRIASSVASENPTILALAGSALVMKKGTAATTTLTSGSVAVSGLAFQNLTASTTKGSVRVGVTFTSVNPLAAQRPELSFSNTYYMTTTLR